VEVSSTELAQVYAGKSDEELNLLYLRGKLTSTAYVVLEDELRQRGLAIPERPTLEPDGTDREGRVDLLRSITETFSWMPVWYIALPQISAYPATDVRLLCTLVVVSLIPVLFFIRGVQALLYSGIAAQRPRAVLYGAIAASLFLAMTPRSLSLALDEPLIRIVPIPLGAFVALLYLWYAYKS
jgi:hypothetical protein